MKKSTWYWIGGGLLAIIGISLATSAGANKTPEVDPQQNLVGGPNDHNERIITNFDATWDYKVIAGAWFTKKKNDTVWLDMKTTLSPENYKIAVDKLQGYLPV